MIAPSDSCKKKPEYFFFKTIPETVGYICNVQVVWKVAFEVKAESISHYFLYLIECLLKYLSRSYWECSIGVNVFLLWEIRGVFNYRDNIGKLVFNTQNLSEWNPQISRLPPCYLRCRLLSQNIEQLFCETHGSFFMAFISPRDTTINRERK